MFFSIKSNKFNIPTTEFVKNLKRLAIKFKYSIDHKVYSTNNNVANSNTYKSFMMLMLVYNLNHIKYNKVSLYSQRYQLN